MKLRQISIMVLVAFLAAACQGGLGGNLTGGTRPSIPTPQAGKVTVTGRIFSKKTGKPLDNTVVRLAEIVRQNGQAAFVLDEAFSPGNYSDAQGYFVMASIDPKEYMVVVGIVPDNYTIYSESGKPKTWVTNAGQTLDVGDLTVDYTSNLPPVSTPTKTANPAIPAPTQTPYP
jgi:hypothetical protein